jgi:hypothetical protein
MTQLPHVLKRIRLNSPLWGDCLSGSDRHRNLPALLACWMLLERAAESWETRDARQ